jgi:hypothetical protein
MEFHDFTLKRNGMRQPIYVEQQCSDTEKYTPRIRQIKASFAGCSLSDRALFPQSSCILPISIMGHKEHECPRFQATIRRVNASFKSCALLIGDTLQRHNLKIEYPNHNNEKLYDLAEQLGTRWLERNQTAYKTLSIPYQIIRWSKYLQHSGFQEKLNLIECLYDTDVTYRAALDETAEQYLSRYLKLHNTRMVCVEHVLFAALDYLKEECAAMCLWSEGEYNFELYPTGRCVAMAVTYERLIQPLTPSLLRPVSLRFKKG